VTESTFRHAHDAPDDIRSGQLRVLPPKRDRARLVRPQFREDPDNDVHWTFFTSSEALARLGASSYHTGLPLYSGLRAYAIRPFTVVDGPRHNGNFRQSRLLIRRQAHISEFTPNQDDSVQTGGQEVVGNPRSRWIVKIGNYQRSLQSAASAIRIALALRRPFRRISKDGDRLFCSGLP